MTMDLVSNQRIFRDYGVTVERVQPPKIEVSIDELVERDAKVVVPPNLKNVAATFTPPTVKVKGPKVLLDHAEQSPSLPERGQLIVYAAASAVRAHTGHYDLPDIAVTAPDDLKDDRIQINDGHAKVHAIVDISRPDKRYMFNSLTVTFDAPIPILDKYSIVSDRPAVQNVTVVGPPELIDAMQKPDFEPKPKAHVLITAADLTGGGDLKTKVVDYDMPKGVEVIPEDMKKTVEFRLVDRTTPAAP